MALKGFFKSLFDSKTDISQRFEVQRSAISGTMSKFYMVTDRKTHEQLGLKVLDKRETELFEQRLKVKKPPEGEIAMLFDHPHIVKTIEHGITTKDEQYLVMEYLHGSGLNSLIIGKDARLEGKRLALIRQAAEALDTVHEAGYIHRDVCPRNFVVAPDLQSLKLIDFGLTLPNTPDFTQPGNRTGTPAYMSPEVVRRKPTSPKLDIFSFGVTAYEMMTYRRPWEAGTDGQAALAHDSVAPMSIKKLRPTIHPDLAEVIMQCLRPVAEDRPRSMGHLLRRIDKVEHEDVK